MSEVNEEVKDKEEVKVVKKRAPSKKNKESKVGFDFSDQDIKDFKEWQEAKKSKDQGGEVFCGQADDDKVYRAWKEESRLVKGVFRCREPEGGSVRFAFKKYKWDQVKWYTMLDGETYEVPLAVARHLNKNCNYPIHSHILGADGNPTVDRQGRVKSRMNFESTEFSIA